MTNDNRKRTYKWFNDGSHNIKVYDGDDVLNEYKPGRIKKKDTSQSVENEVSFSHFKELDGLTEQEKKYALSILSELSSAGTSDKYNKLIFEDYNEIPVDIETFLHNKKYLGRGLIDDEGRFTVFPYWEETLKKIFPDSVQPARYNTLALTGSIGIGKSFMAVLCGLYELYRMLCLKDPYLHYGLQPIDKITFAFMNITIDAAKGVAWDKCQQLLQSSEWFLSRGTVSKSQNPEWKPPSGIELIYGSQSRHIIGRAVYWCLDGDTIINTTEGDRAISELVDRDIKVTSYSETGEAVISEVCTVKPTAVCDEEYQIALEDGTIIKCTPEHRFMLTDGTYKEAQYLAPDDDILEYSPCGYIYRTTNLVTGGTYVGQHKCTHFDRHYYGSGLRILREVSKYGKSNFKVEVLGWAKTVDSLKDLETFYIEREHQITDKCLNLSSGAKGGHENYSHSQKAYVNRPLLNKVCITDGINKYIESDAEVPYGWKIGNCHTSKPHNMSRYYLDENSRIKNSQSKSGKNNSQFGHSDSHRGERNGRYNKPTSDSTKQLISKALTGRRYSDSINAKKGRPGISKPTGFGDKVSQASIGKRQYNDGTKNIWVMRDETVPEGFVRGWIHR